MTLSASPYAVFRAEEWVSAVAQPIGIGQCLRLTPKKLTPIRSSIKNKKNGNTLRKGFSKKKCSACVCMICQYFNYSSDKHSEQFFRVMFIVDLFLMEIICFTLPSLDAVKRESDWLVSRGGLTIGIAQFVYTNPYHLISI